MARFFNRGKLVENKILYSVICLIFVLHGPILIFDTGTVFSTMNLKGLFQTINNEESAVALLQSHGILHRERACKNGHEMKLSGNLWRCRKNKCDEKIGVRVGTWLATSRITLETVVHFIYCWALKMTSINFCREELGIGHDTTVDWNDYMREVCVRKLQQNQQPIGGPGMTVEIDESLFAKRKNNAGRILPQQWVLGGICRENKECFIVTIPDRSEKTMLPLVYKWVRPGTLENPTIVMSDKWKSYNKLGKDGRYKHMTVNHSKNFIDPNSGAHTQTIERTWGLSKEGNKRRRGTHRHLLNSYISEYLWRSKLGEKKAFEEILKNIAEIWPPEI